MAFKSIKKERKTIKKDIEALFRDLKTNGVESLYSHQADILRNYQKLAFDDPNVAIELPTGSGKTLIGLLIAEHKRKTFDSKVIYLCPTRQLVNQVTELADKNYGIKAIPFLGSKRKYSAQDKTKYNNAEAIAVTTYSSLFNINPYFDDPDFIIIDDAHASENYIATNWSLQINRHEHPSVYKGIIELFAGLLNEVTHMRLLDDQIDPLDKKTIYTLPNYSYYNQKSHLIHLIDTLVEGTDLRYSWNLIKDHLDACNIFYSWNEILIRPLVPPSLTNDAFSNAKQRIFMSATLGNGGDLERITGVNNITRIGIPDGWDKHGLGRRFFQFPGIQLESEEVEEFILEAMKMTPRSVFLVSSERDVEDLQDLVEKKASNFDIYKAKDIEQTKDDFVVNDKGVAIMANRFDGIDFPGNDCRLLVIKDIPYHSNIQEKFLQSKMDASIIFYDRNRTRLIQALGRCTRSPKDFSAVIVIGEKDLTEWLFYKDKNKYFHPELQAELRFGFENSRADKNELLENLQHFFNQDSEWELANKSIIENRNEIETSEIEGINQLESTVELELKYVYSLWNSDLENALIYCDKVLDKLSGGKRLKGYRAYWKFLKCNLCFQLYKSTAEKHYFELSKQTYEEAANLSAAFRSVKLSAETSDKIFPYDEYFEYNIERVLEFLNSKNIANTTKFLRYIEFVETLVKDPRKIEEAQVEIGQLLGYNTINPENSGAPDPIWISNQNHVLVFEDKIYNNSKKEIPLKDIRQAGTHHSWIMENIDYLAENTKIQTIFLSNSSYLSADSKFAANSLFYWNHNLFIEWSIKFLAFVKNLQVKYTEKNDETWQDFVKKEYFKRGYNPIKIIEALKPINSL